MMAVTSSATLAFGTQLSGRDGVGPRPCQVAQAGHLKAGRSQAESQMPRGQLPLTRPLMVMAAKNASTISLTIHPCWVIQSLILGRVVSARLPSNATAIAGTASSRVSATNGRHCHQGVSCRPRCSPAAIAVTMSDGKTPSRTSPRENANLGSAFCSLVIHFGFFAVFAVEVDVHDQ